MTNKLFFNYPSTARIRFKIINCLENEQFPYIYKIKTEKLEFTIPKSMTIIGKTHAFIPLDYYKNILSTFYHSIKTH